MATNKDALYQFQSRLSNRLHSTEEHSTAAHWLAVEVSGSGFVLPLSQSGEIFPWAEPHPVPYTKNWFLGVANLRGALCGVVSLSKYFQLDSSMGRTKSSLLDKRLIGFHPTFELNTVLVVDRLAGLKSREQLIATDVATRYQDQQGRDWQEIDLRLLTHDASFVSIAAT